MLDNDAGAFRIFDVWESQEQAEKFMDGQLMPVVADLMANVADGDVEPPHRQSFYDQHDVIHPERTTASRYGRVDCWKRATSYCELAL